MAISTRHYRLLGLVCLTLCANQNVVSGQEIPTPLLGDWSLQLDSKTPAWLSIQQQDGRPLVFFRLYVGSAGPYHDVTVEGGRLKFVMRKKRKSTAQPATVEVGLKDGKLDGLIVRPRGQGGQVADGRATGTKASGGSQQIRFTGQKIGPMPTSAPDLSKVQFGPPVVLFNGNDLTGWKPHESDKVNGWSVVDGVMKNSTPKTDFSATGAYANLKTEAVYEDFRLHIEFLVEAKRNSGIYLRGMYEAQVVDRDSPMQGIQGPGAIFGAIAPTENAGMLGGEWQAYDITLVDRHITVVLNGTKVIDNLPISRPTAGAIHTNPGTAGPIYLQGDHTAVSYRNIYLEPVVHRR